MSETASFNIPVTSNAADVGNEGAAALEALRSKIQASKGAIAEFSASLKNLRGSSDEVKGAKASLVAQIEVEKAAISSASLAILKQGSSFGKLEAQTRAAASAQKQMADAYAKASKMWEAKQVEDARKKLEELKAGVASTGDPVGGLVGRWKDLKAAMGSAEGVMALTITGFVALAAAAVTVVGAIAAVTASFVKWLVVSSDANRTLAIQREAWTGSAENAKHLGEQIDLLATKVPTAKEKLNELAGSTVKALNNTRVSGQGIVDTFNAVAVASAAMGDEVGNTLAEIIKAGKMSGRVAIVAPQLQGTGLKIQDVAAEIAQMMHVSTAAAVQALAQGRVKVDDAAAAIRKAVEKRFGEINARKLLSLDSIAQKLRESFSALTKDVHLEPLLEGLKQIAGLFSQSTVSGKVLHDVITIIGNKLGPALKGLAPIARAAFLQIEIGALKIAIAVLKAGKTIRQAFAGHEDLVTTANAIKLVVGYIEGLTTGAIAVVRVFATGFALITRAVFAVGAGIEQVKKGFGGWIDVGKGIIDGIVAGITAGIEKVKSTVSNLAESIKATFKGALQIGSPSKVFAEYGKDTSEGYERGVGDGAPAAQSAVNAMAPGPPMPAARGGGRGGAGGGPLHVEVNLHVEGGAHAQATAKAVQDVIPELVDALRALLTSAGVPVGSEVPT